MFSLKKVKEKVTGAKEYIESDSICEKLSFTSAEEYKMIRTKIDLVLPNELLTDEVDGSTYRKCHIIGVTSSLRGEGKSTTAINLSYTFAEAGYKVCLLEADMRLPSISPRLGLKETPGLSNVLTGNTNIRDAIQIYSTKKGIEFRIITAGDLPPLPSELLSSTNMEAFLRSLAEVYDYVIIDLPPVNAVTDALALSKLDVLDGMLFVVRERVGNKNALRHALDQFRITNTKIIGIVYNGYKTHVSTSKYYRGSSKDNYYNNNYYRKK